MWFFISQFDLDNNFSIVLEALKVNKRSRKKVEVQVSRCVIFLTNFNSTAFFMCVSLITFYWVYCDFDDYYYI